MKIKEIVNRVKSYYQGTNPDGTIIDDLTSRDQYLFDAGDTDCTGIVVTCFASIAVIKEAINRGANLIICHEALFWNHGDKTDWLENNTVFKQKRDLLEKHGIVVWRNHDYIHSGMLVADKYVDGIFYGLMKTLDWEKYAVKSDTNVLNYEFPNVSVQEIGQQLVKKLHLNGLRIVGDSTTIVQKLRIAGHIMGGDNATITEIENDSIDALIALELIDYTVSEYIRDASQIGKSKVILSVGHFNVEEFGMAYMVNYLPEIIEYATNVSFLQSGDTYTYLT